MEVVKSISTDIEPRHSEQIVILDDVHSVKFWNGLLYLDYLETLTDLTRIMTDQKDVSFSNQVVSIIEEETSIKAQMKEDDSPQSRLFNWTLLQKHYLGSPLKISVDATTLCIAKDQEEI